MPVSKKRKKPASSKLSPSRNKKLYLLLPKVEADELCLQARLAFEAVRRGTGDRSAALNMSAIALMCENLTAGGNGLLPLPFLSQVREGAFEALDDGDASGWQFSPTLVEGLLRVVNEYDRQIRETRLHAIIEASNKVNRFLENRIRARVQVESSIKASD